MEEICSRSVPYFKGIFLFIILVKYNIFFLNSSISPMIGVVTKSLHAICLMWASLIFIVDLIGGRNLLKDRFKGILFLFLIFYAATVVFNASANLFSNIVGWVSFLAYYFVVYSFDRSCPAERVRREMSLINQIVIYFSFLSGVISLYIFFSGVHRNYGDLLNIGVVDGRLFGFAGNPNRDAIIAVISIAVIFYELLSWHILAAYRRWFYVSNLMLQLLILALGKSRGGQLMLAVFFMIYVFIWLGPILRERYGAGWRIFVARLLVLLLPLGFLIFFASVRVLFFNPSGALIPGGKVVSEMSAIAQRPSSGEWSSGRIDLWRSCLGMVGKHPVFGVGFKNVEPYCRAENPEKKLGALEAGLHNTFFHAIVGAGIFGFTLICSFVFALGQTLLRVWVQLEKNPQMELSRKTWFISLLVSLVLYSTYENGPFFFHNFPNVAFWIYLGYFFYFSEVVWKISFRKPIL